MHPLVHIAVRAARRAGKIIISNFDRLAQVQVRQKSPNNLVSVVDELAEQEIIDTIRRAHPDHAILAEERGGELGGETEAQFQWIIDPLDGTFNYLHTHPHVAISIAVRRRGQTEHGVIFDPLRDEMYTASRGQGARRDDRRIHVSEQAAVARALIATGFPHQVTAHDDANLQIFTHMATRAAALRCHGAAALDLAYVACGRVDGYWQTGLQPWDMAAGALLVREAGGLAADFSGAQNCLRTGQIIAANPILFDRIMRALARAAPLP